MSGRTFPIQQPQRGEPCEIPWEIAECAYQEYVSKYGDRQTLERLAERGGFAWLEVVDLLYSALRRGAGKVKT